MRYLALAFALGLCLWAASAPAQSIGPPNEVICNKTATFTGVSAVTTLVPAVSGKTIVMCGWHVTTSSTSSVTFAITSGTQTTNPCDTATQTITPALSLLNSAPSSDHIDFAISTIPTANALCITPSSTTISGVIYYAQF